MKMNRFEKIKQAKNIKEMADLLPFREEYCNVCYFEDFCNGSEIAMDNCEDVLMQWLESEIE